MTEDELEIFDLLKKPKMTKDEEQAIKLAAKSLLESIRNKLPPVPSYDKEVFRSKRDLIIKTMTDYAYQGRKFASAH